MELGSLLLRGGTLKSDDSITFDTTTKVFTTTVDNQIFYFDKTTAHWFFFKAISGNLSFDVNKSSDSRLAVTKDAINGSEGGIGLRSFRVNGLTGSTFEFVCKV